MVIDSTTAGGVVRVFDANRSMELVLGHEDRESSLFRESATPAGTETVALLGNLRQPSAADLLELMGHWPLLDPRLTRTHQPDSHRRTVVSGDDDGDNPQAQPAILIAATNSVRRQDRPSRAESQIAIDSQAMRGVIEHAAVGIHIAGHVHAIAEAIYARDDPWIGERVGLGRPFSSCRTGRNS